MPQQSELPQGQSALAGEKRKDPFPNAKASRHLRSSLTCHRHTGNKNLEDPGSGGYEEPTLSLVDVIRNSRWFSVNLTNASVVLEGEPQLRKYLGPVGKSMRTFS